MEGLIWEPACRPDDIDLEPAPTDVITMLSTRERAQAVGVVVAVGRAVLTMRPGDLVRFPMLDVTDRAKSCLIGFAKVPVRGRLLLRIPLAEYNVELLESSVTTSPPPARGGHRRVTPSQRAWQSLMDSGRPR